MSDHILTNPCKHFTPPQPTGSFGTATVGPFVCPWCEMERLEARATKEFELNKRLREALRKLTNGFKYSAEVCTIAREALDSPAAEPVSAPGICEHGIQQHCPKCHGTW